MPALKSHNPTEAIINKNFIIRIQFTGVKGTILTTAAKYHTYVGKKLTETHFLKALNGGKDKYMFKIRNRLTINFHGK